MNLCLSIISLFHFWCRDLCNCLLKAIDKASDILMFVLPPNLQNCSLLEFTPHQSVLFPLHPPILFLLLLFLCCDYTTCSQWYWALASLLLFLTLVGYSHTCTPSQSRKGGITWQRYVCFYIIPLLMFVWSEEKNVKTCLAIIGKTVFHWVVYWAEGNTFPFPIRN